MNGKLIALSVEAQPAVVSQLTQYTDIDGKVSKTKDSTY
jgi:hypothetical protein